MLKMRTGVALGRRSLPLMARPATLSSFSSVRFYSDKKNELIDSSNELVINEEKLGLNELSGAPKELLERTVRIFKQAPSATQSGRRQQKGWRINWDIVPRANKWEDSTIGYAASGDYMQATELHFHTKEDAIGFATRQGWNYYVQEPKARTFKPKSYSDNFLHSSGPLKFIFTK